MPNKKTTENSEILSASEFVTADPLLELVEASQNVQKVSVSAPALEKKKNVKYNEHQLLDEQKEESNEDTTTENDSKTAVDQKIEAAVKPTSDVSPAEISTSSAQNKDVYDAEKVANIMQYLPEAVAEKFKEISLQREEDADQFKKKTLEVLSNYNNKGPVTRAEVDHLRHVVWVQHKCMLEMEDQYKDQMKDHAAKADKITKLVEDLITKGEENDEKLMQLAKVAAEKVIPKNEQRTGCYFCGSHKHAGVVCYQFTTAASRQAEIRREGKCIACLQPGHDEMNCKKIADYKPCDRCKPKQYHHRSLCPKRCDEAATRKKQLQYEEEGLSKEPGEKRAEKREKSKEKKDEKDGIGAPAVKPAKPRIQFPQ